MRATVCLVRAPAGEIFRHRAWRSVAVLLGLLAAPPAHSQIQATTLPLLYPWAIAFDAQGNLYFAETNNHVIREVTPAGVLTTVAGTGTQGFSGENGPATAAQLDSPAGLAIDSAGNLYLADTHNHRIRKLTAATGILTTVAGTGIAGFSGDNGPATAAQLNHPTALAIDSSGNLYLADTLNHRIRKLTASTGILATVAGNGIEAFTGDNGLATSASIDSPAGLALDSSGNLYLADTRNHRIRFVSAATGLITTLAGIASPNGSPQPFAGDNGPATSATLALPRGLAIDSSSNLYLADSANQRIRRIAANGGAITTASTIATVAGQGTETFAGDGAPAVAASLDTPRSVALPPSGLLTLADTGNARVRQLDQLPLPGPDIHTIAGLTGSTGTGSGSGTGSGGTGSGGTGTLNPDTLSLAGPSTVAYGSGSLTATLTTQPIATGSVTFLDTIAGSTTTLATTTLISDAATVPTSTLSAGSHSITATYPGDSTHTAAQSPAFALSITPLPLTATPTPASILYGQPIPTLSGTLTGVLPQDSTKVSATFTTTAATLSPAGLYPITGSLSGPSAADYTLSTPPASLTIAPAPTLTTLAASTASTSLGLPITLALKAASTTSGTPTGAIQLFDGSSPISTQTLASGASAYTTSSLALGPHTLSAVYSGDANFLPSTSASITLTITPASDFSITPAGPTAQSIPAGSSATFTFNVATQGAALSSPIALAVAGVPLGVTASLNPQTLPPGGAVTTFTLTLQTPVALAHPPQRFTPRALPAVPNTQPRLLFPALLLPLLASYRLRRKAALAAASCLLLAVFASGCGNRVNNGASPEVATSPTYTLTVTGTATSPTGAALQHSATVTLQVR